MSDTIQAALRTAFQQGRFEPATAVMYAYHAFKSEGCTAAMWVDDRYDRERHWVGLKGTSAQIAAAYHESQKGYSTVAILLDLTAPLGMQWTSDDAEKSIFTLTKNPIIARTLQPAIAAHNVEEYRTLPIAEQIATAAKIVLALQLTF